MGGLWIHKIERCGGPESAVSKALGMGADRLIVKARDGRGRYNSEHICELAERTHAAGISLWLWSWHYSTDTTGAVDYCKEQGQLIAGDSNDLKADGVILNVEAPFSWSKMHRWGQLHESMYGNKASRKAAMRERARELILGVRSVLDEPTTLAVSSFPLPSQHALPFDILARGADLVCPQIYFSGMGYKPKVRKSVEQWTKLGAERLRFSGPGWRGPTKMRSMGSSVRLHQCPRSPIDWWVLDKMDDADLEAARIFGEVGARCSIA